MTIGEAIRQKRQEAELSQGQLARRIGMFPGQLSNAERNQYNITLESLDKIARGLRIPASAIVRLWETGENDPPQ